MRKDILLPGLAVGAGVLGFAIRWWQWAAGHDPDTQLFLTGHPAFYALLLLLAALTAALVLSLRNFPEPDKDNCTFGSPSPVYMTLMAASALLFLGSGALGLLESMQQLALWRAAPDSHQLTYPLAIGLCALLALVSGPATLSLGQAGYRGNASPLLPLLVNFPPLAALVWVFATHLANSTNPVLLSYGPSLAAAVFLLLALYDTAAVFHDRPHPFRLTVSAALGSALGMISLADGLSLFQMALTAACVLSVLANSWTLLRNTFGPPWPTYPSRERMPLGAQDEDDEDDELDF